MAEALQGGGTNSGSPGSNASSGGGTAAYGGNTQQSATSSTGGQSGDQGFFGAIGDAFGKITGAVLGDSQSVSGYSVAEIGKPFRFTKSVDPGDRTYQFLLTRMNAVDIYPCNYAQNFLFSSQKKKTRFQYGITYDYAMKRYQKMCKNYLGDSRPPSALRIFLTDDTVVTDGVGTQYRTNFFQTMADKLSNMAQNITSMASSMTSQGMQEGVDKALSYVNTEKIASAIGDNVSFMSGHKDIMGNILDGLKQGAAIVLKGNKLSLPKIWDNSNYTPTFSVSTRLFSPYGSPKAVKEFIIKPLVYMLLMAVPQSEDMVSYGRPFAVTVRSWGTSFLTLAGITSISLQRGGSDSVYNIYKQPLIINVNMEFTSLVDGIIAHATSRDNDPRTEIPPYEADSFKTCDQILALDARNQTIDGGKIPTVVPTIGGMIRSLQPVVFADVNRGFGPQESTRYLLLFQSCEASGKTLSTLS